LPGPHPPNSRCTRRPASPCCTPPPPRARPSCSPTSSPSRSWRAGETRPTRPSAPPCTQPRSLAVCAACSTCSPQAQTRTLSIRTASERSSSRPRACWPLVRCCKACCLLRAAPCSTAAHSSAASAQSLHQRSADAGPVALAHAPAAQPTRTANRLQAPLYRLEAAPHLRRASPSCSSTPSPRRSST
jgi:hypothetical protein